MVSGNVGHGREEKTGNGEPVEASERNAKVEKEKMNGWWEIIKFDTDEEGFPIWTLRQNNEEEIEYTEDEKAVPYRAGFLLKDGKIIDAVDDEDEAEFEKIFRHSFSPYIGYEGDDEDDEEFEKIG